MLEDIPGGEPNLLPVALVRAPLRVDVPIWEVGETPTPEKWQKLILFWDEQLVGEKIWEEEIRPEDLFIDVPLRFLREGRASVRYEVKVWSSNNAESETLVLTIDKTAPWLGGDEGALSFPDLGSERLTKEYLEAHGDVLAALAPDYDEPGAGDTLIYYWDTTPLERHEAGRRVLDLVDIGQPLLIEYSGDLIRERGDGTFYAYYAVEDRAGNLSRDSRQVTVEVAVQPLPRVLEWLDVPEASGSQQLKVLALERAKVSVEMVIPDEAVILPGEPFTVRWGEPELPFSLAMNGVPNVRSYSVPIRNVVAMNDKTLSIYYEVDTPEGLQRSVERKVEVTPVPRQRMTTAQLAKHPSGSTFYLGQHTRDPAVTLAPWLHIGTEQMLNIMLEGVTASGPKIHPVLLNHAVTADEVTGGIGWQGDVTVPLDVLRQLKVGEDFYIKVSASFDQGETWPAQPNFPMLVLKLAN